MCDESMRGPQLYTNHSPSHVHVLLLLARKNVRVEASAGSTRTSEGPFTRRSRCWTFTSATKVLRGRSLSRSWSPAMALIYICVNLFPCHLSGQHGRAHPDPAARALVGLQQSVLYLVSSSRTTPSTGSTRCSRRIPSKAAVLS